MCCSSPKWLRYPALFFFVTFTYDALFMFFISPAFLLPCCLHWIKLYEGNCFVSLKPFPQNREPCMVHRQRAINTGDWIWNELMNHLYHQRTDIFLGIFLGLSISSASQLYEPFQYRDPIRNFRCPKESPAQTRLQNIVQGRLLSRPSERPSWWGLITLPCGTFTTFPSFLVFLFVFSHVLILSFIVDFHVYKKRLSFCS